MTRTGAVLGVVLCVLSGTAIAARAADAIPWGIAVGYQYASGEYGAGQTITETYVPVTVAYRFPWAAVRVTVPYVSVSGPATLIDEASGEFAPGPGGTRSGLGDVIVSGTLYDLMDSQATEFYLDMTGTIKFATARASAGLGSAENDYAVQLDALKEFGRVGLFGAAGYLVRGAPGRIALRNVPFGTVGTDLLLRQGVRGGLSFSYRTSAIAHYDSVKEATVFVAFAGPGGLIVHPSVFKGFGDSSPAWGAGVQLSWRSPAGGSLYENQTSL